MNKSAGTNLLAALIAVIGFLLPHPWRDPVLSVGVFALSGALTNWLAVHMLFEKVPGLYGSGIIPERFEDFKAGIHDLMMTQFFTRENVVRLLSGRETDGTPPVFDVDPVLESVDLSGAFDALLEAVKGSKFGSMLGMVGGEKALDPLREPFTEKLRVAMAGIARSDAFQTALREQLVERVASDEILEAVDHVVTARLDELTPQLVKEIVQTMIREHLGWLVVWGGVFGGLIGLVVSLLGAGVG